MVIVIISYCLLFSRIAASISLTRSSRQFVVATNFVMAGLAGRRIEKELNDLKRNPIDGIEIVPDENNPFVWFLTMRGPPESPFKGVDLKLKVIFTQKYPYLPPRVIFISEVFHPNTDALGEVSIPLLREANSNSAKHFGDSSKDNWAVVNRVDQVLINILKLMSVPDIDKSINTEAAKLFINDRKSFRSINRILLGQEEEDEEADEIKEENDAEQP